MTMLKAILFYIMKRLDELSFWVGIALLLTFILLPDGLSMFIVVSIALVLTVMPDSKFSNFMKRISKLFTN